MGSGYNSSLAASNAARRKSQTFAPISLYLNVPKYTYILECGHEFTTRTPFVENAEEHEKLLAYCSRCQDYMTPNSEPENQPISNDEWIAFEQDKGLLRERIALEIQRDGYLATEKELAEAARMFGIPVAEIRRINAGLKAPENASGQPDLCRKGLHELVGANVGFEHGKRRCQACRLARQQQERRAKKKTQMSPPRVVR